MTNSLSSTKNKFIPDTDQVVFPIEAADGRNLSDSVNGPELGYMWIENADKEGPIVNFGGFTGQTGHETYSLHNFQGPLGRDFPENFKIKAASEQYPWDINVKMNDINNAIHDHHSILNDEISTSYQPIVQIMRAKEDISGHVDDLHPLQRGDKSEPIIEMRLDMGDTTQEKAIAALNEVNIGKTPGFAKDLNNVKQGEFYPRILGGATVPEFTPILPVYSKCNITDGANANILVVMMDDNALDPKKTEYDNRLGLPEREILKTIHDAAKRLSRDHHRYNKLFHTIFVGATPSANLLRECSDYTGIAGISILPDVGRAPKNPSDPDYAKTIVGKMNSGEMTVINAAGHGLNLESAANYAGPMHDAINKAPIEHDLKYDRGATTKKDFDR